MLLTADALGYFGGLLFKPLQDNIRIELLFVMIFCPGVLNVIYFWVADHYLKAGAEHTGAHEEDPVETELAKKKESLLAVEDEMKTPKIWMNDEANDDDNNNNISAVV